MNFIQSLKPHFVCLRPKTLETPPAAPAAANPEPEVPASTSQPTKPREDSEDSFEEGDQYYVLRHRHEGEPHPTRRGSLPRNFHVDILPLAAANASAAPANDRALLPPPPLVS